MELEGAEVRRLKALATRLQIHHYARLAFTHSTPHTSAAWVHCLPVWSCACPDNLFPGVVAAYLGAPVPYYAPHVGHRRVVNNYRGRQAYETDAIDQFGIVLAAPLQSRLTRLHHHLVWRLHDLAVRSRTDDFHSAVREPAHLLGATNPADGQFRAIIPDIKVVCGRTDTMYDVKTMSYSKTSWGNPDVVHNVTRELLTTPGRVLEARARHEHADYLRRARAIDGLTGVAAGAVGPVEARLLRDFGPLRPAHHARRGDTHSTPVHMLVVGPFANVSRDFEEYLNTCAAQMCKAACQGMQPDDASEYLSVVVASVRKEMGMTIARETARMHQDMACELAAGRIQEPVPDRFPPIGAAGVGDYFDDDHDEAVVVGTL